MRRPVELPVLLISIAIFIILYLLYIFSLNPVLPTGDAGGLITASYFLGTAHPSGYPLYSEIGKLFSFIPIGNIGFRVSLLPLFFSLTTLFLVYLVSKELISLKNDSKDTSLLKNWQSELIPLIAVLAVGISYSFYFQTIIGKFYPLNASIVMILLFLGVKILKYGFDQRYLYLSSFILGLSTGLHHTVLFMAIPLLILGFMNLRHIIKHVPLLILFFSLGFSINLHIYIRNLKEAFFALRKEGVYTSFFEIFFRKVYKQGASLEAIKSVLDSFEGYLKGIKNFLYMTDSNFGIVTLIFFVLGLFFIFRNNWKLFLFVVSSFLMYSIFLSKITLTGEITNIATLYISGNQYFIPAFCIYAVIFICGIYMIVRLIKKAKLALITISLILLLFFSFIPFRYLQTSQSNNWVVYYYCKDLLTFPPISSVIATFTDNQIFGIWYLKLIGRYRDDICHLSIIKYDSTQWNMEGCKPFDHYSSESLKKGEILSFMKRGLFYSTIGLTSVHSLSKVADMSYTFGGFIYLPKNQEKTEIATLLDERIKKIRNLFTLDYCLNHNTDDPSTFSTCKYVGLNSLVIARSIKPEIKVTKYNYQTSFIFDEGEIPINLEIDLGVENVKYFEIFDDIGRYNDYKRSFLHK